MAGADEVALAGPVLVGFVRVVTKPRIMTDPAPASVAMEFVDAVRSARRGRVVSATAGTWSANETSVEGDRLIRGNLVPDAWLAALAVAHSAEIATTDRGFARFPGVTSFDPGSTGSRAG